jgi:hypothetical protein
MLRLYTFCNFYLSSIQQGIQSAHIVSELFVDYRFAIGRKEEGAQSMLYDWANNFKTIIVCNGGTSKEILDTYNALVDMQLNKTYPMAIFNEEPGALDSIGGAVTGFGIILPAEIYGAEFYEDKSLKAGYWYHQNGQDVTSYGIETKESMLIDYIKSRPLAR